MEISTANCKELILDVLKAQLVPFVAGSPGIGKSAIAFEIAKENNLEVIDIRLSQLDPSELQGFPMKMGDKAGYVPMNIFPIESDPIPVGKNGWLVLLDEFNSATMATQAAAYKLVLDRMVGMYKLHPRAAVIAAGNLVTDKAIVNRISTAMQSRLVHFQLSVDHEAWIKWADKNDIDHRIKSFIHFKPQALYNFNPSHNEETFPCPRTWEFSSKLIKPYSELPYDKLPLLAGAIGEGMAREAFAFFKIYGEVPTIQEIQSNPTGVRLGDEPSLHYALSGLIAHHLSDKNANALLKFLARLNIDFQVICLRSAIARNSEIKKSQAVKDWIVHNAREML